MHADFEALCIDGSTTVEVRATRANINGALAIGVANGALVATLPTSAVTLDGFALNIGGVPGAIEDLVEGEARKAAQKALNNAIRDQVPPKASEALGGLLAKPFQATILDRMTKFTMVPDAVTITPDGLVAAVNTKVLVTGGEGGVYATSPAPLTPGVWQSGDLAVALADDVMNQLFAGLWAADALTPTIPLEGNASIVAALLDDDARSLALDMKLPPTVKANGGVLELAVGDMLINVRDANDTQIQQFALSIITSLSATPTATGVYVAVGTPTVKAQLLAQTEAIDDPMTDVEFESMVGGAWGLVGGLMDEALAKMPLPTVSGLTLGTPGLTGNAGFVVIDVPMQ
jgi:hypothetical protein